MADLLSVERDGGVDVVILNRPPVNAINAELLLALTDVFGRIAADPKCRAVVLTGSARAFSAGGDVAEMAALDGPHARRIWVDRGQRLCDAISATTRPVIAAIEGYCLGGGLELALACHLRIAAEGARIGLPEATLGLLPGFGGTQRLPRLVGEGPALELMLTAEPISAQRAAELRLVNRAVPSGEALTTAKELARKMVDLSGPSLAGILAVVAGGRDEPLRDALDAELNAFVALLGGADGRAGMRAFLEKRKARFGESPPRS